MRPVLLLLIAGLYLVEGCKKESNSCNYLPAGVGLEFRITDTFGNDLVYALKDTLITSQPCHNVYLTTQFKDYRIPGGTDSGTVISFGNLRTPEYGESNECYRILFTWPNDDEDTVDWHYRIEELDGCKLQVIDYISYNGTQAVKKTDYVHEYYQLVKR